MGVSHFSAISSTFSAKELGSMTANVTLTTQEAADVGVVTGIPTAARNLVFPAGSAPLGKIVIVRNLAPATHALTVKVGDSTGVAVAATKSAILMGNGTDFVRIGLDA